MVATRGFEELLHKEPLLRLVDTGAELAAELNRLREIRFEDGLAEARWRASLEGTWDNRAAAVVEALHKRWQPKSGTGYECEPAEAAQDFAR
jgi:hypothetical protein